jgi:hypothetical protein
VAISFGTAAISFGTAATGSGTAATGPESFFSSLVSVPLESLFSSLVSVPLESFFSSLVSVPLGSSFGFFAPPGSSFGVFAPVEGGLKRWCRYRRVRRNRWNRNRRRRPRPHPSAGPLRARTHLQRNESAAEPPSGHPQRKDRAPAVGALNCGKAAPTHRADRSLNRTSLSMVTTHAWGRHPYCLCRHPLYLGDAARNF